MVVGVHVSEPRLVVPQGQDLQLPFPEATVSVRRGGNIIAERIPAHGCTIRIRFESSLQIASFLPKCQAALGYKERKRDICARWTDCHGIDVAGRPSALQINIKAL